LKLGPALNLNQNPFFEMASRNKNTFISIPHLMQGRVGKISCSGNRREEIHVSDTQKTIGLQEALEMTLANTHPLPVVKVPLLEGLNRVIATDVPARVDSPSMDASLMDGYAVRASDLSGATNDRPVALELAGTATAGSPPGQIVKAQQALRVMTGAPIPSGADAVVPEEFTTRHRGLILFHRGEKSGANILPRGSDVVLGQVVSRAGQLVTPGMAGLLVAAGLSQVEVIRQSLVALIATGDEVVAPGNPLAEGKLYASNIMTLDGWCRRYGFRTQGCVVGDTLEEIYRTLEQTIDQVDVVVSSGGAWSGDKDLVVQALEGLGWKEIFHGIRMIPGKGTGFGLLYEKPVFILPGGPSANLMGFLQVVLPGLLTMAGYGYEEPPEIIVRLGSELHGKHMEWTQFVYGTLERQSNRHVFHPLLTRSRLEAAAMAQAIVAIPEGESHLPAGTLVRAQVLGYKP
jgi:molybdopterin molybdotransferase